MDYEVIKIIIIIYNKRIWYLNEIFIVMIMIGFIGQLTIVIEVELVNHWW